MESANARDTIIEQIEDDGTGQMETIYYAIREACTKSDEATDLIIGLFVDLKLMLEEPRGAQDVRVLIERCLEIAYHYTPEYRASLDWFKLHRQGILTVEHEPLEVMEPIIKSAIRDKAQKDKAQDKAHTGSSVSNVRPIRKKGATK